MKNRTLGALVALAMAPMALLGTSSATAAPVTSPAVSSSTTLTSGGTYGTVCMHWQSWYGTQIQAAGVLLKPGQCVRSNYFGVHFGEYAVSPWGYVYPGGTFWVGETYRIYPMTTTGTLYLTVKRN